MNPFLRAIDRTAAWFNELPFWKATCRVWGQQMASPTFERWLYLRLHQLGLMGKAERSFLEEHVRPGMRVIDVGANLGLYSVLIARRAGPSGRVLGFEPDPELCAALRENARLNAVAVEAHNLALGSAPGQLALHKSVINSGDNHLGQAANPLFRRSVMIEVVRLDDHLPGLAVDLVKIDVQGWELEALRGMRQTLAANASVRIYFEFSPNGYVRAHSTYQELIAFLRGLGFRIFDPIARQELDDDGLARLAQTLAATGYTNLLASRQTPWTS